MNKLIKQYVVMPTTYNLSPTPKLSDHVSPNTTLYGQQRSSQLSKFPDSVKPHLEVTGVLSHLGPNDLRDKLSILKEEQRFFAGSQLLPANEYSKNSLQFEAH
jgi:hypothetical protein